MRNLFAAFLAITMLGAISSQAVAQSNLNLIPDKPRKSAEEIEAEERAQKRYRDSLRTIPNAGPADPWGGMRETPASAKPAAKGAQKPAAKGASHQPR